MNEPFRMLVTQHQERTYRSAYRILGDRDEALDVTQEAFLALHLHPQVIDQGRVAAWLARVVTNRALDRVRRRGRVRLGAQVERADWATPAQAAEATEEQERALAALADLSNRQRQVLSLRLLEQMTFPALAAALEISEGAAKVHFRRGLRALRDRLATRSRHD